MSISPQKRSSVAPLGNMFVSFAKSRLPIPNKPKTHRRTLFLVAPVPFAPLVDAHAFQPPPPYTAHATEYLRVPHNTPEAPHTRRRIGLGLEGVDGLGRLGGVFKGNDTVREEVRRMLSEQRRRTRTSEQPTKRQDVFYVPVRQQRAAFPTPTPGVWRGTISSELKRTASVERRASMMKSETRWLV